MARRRYELTDEEWSMIEPLLPNKPRGVPRVDDRRVPERHPLAVSHWLTVGGDP
jgi:transposase